MITDISEPSSGLVDMFRLYMNDLIESNRLLKVEELSDDRLILALKMATEEYNGAPPLVGAVDGPDNFPITTMLFIGAGVYALQMAGLMHLRNQLTYNDGGISIQINEKEGQYRQWFQDYRNEWKTWVKDYKVTRNYEGAYGQVMSEYMDVNWRR